MLESKQVRYFSQWDLLPLEYFIHYNIKPSGFTFRICISVLNPIDPLASVSNQYLDAEYLHVINVYHFKAEEGAQN